jgi:hypothetical protein
MSSGTPTVLTHKTLAEELKAWDTTLPELDFYKLLEAKVSHTRPIDG